MSFVRLVAFGACVGTGSVGPAVFPRTFLLTIFVLFFFFTLVVISGRLSGLEVFKLLEEVFEKAGSGGIGDVGLLDWGTPGVGAAITCRRGFEKTFRGAEGKGLIVVAVGAGRKLGEIGLRSISKGRRSLCRTGTFVVVLDLDEVVLE